LGCRWLSGLKVPGFIENGMVARLNDARVQVEIDDALVRSRVAKKDADEIVMIKFA